MPDALTFSQLLSSRICHDLISPIGAIKSGLELLEMSQGEDQSEILSLIEQSAEAASRRLSFFRLTFGQAALNNLKSLQELEVLLKNVLDPTKFDLQWTHSALVPPPKLKHWGKVVVNAVLWMSESAPYGGKLAVLTTGKTEEDFGLILEMDAKKIYLPAEVEQALAGALSADVLTARTVQPSLLFQLTAMLERRLCVELNADQTQLVLKI